MPHNGLFETNFNTKHFAKLYICLTKNIISYCFSMHTSCVKGKSRAAERIPVILAICWLEIK
jgi:hypothetical protein